MVSNKKQQGRVKKIKGVRRRTPGQAREAPTAELSQSAEPKEEQQATPAEGVTVLPAEKEDGALPITAPFSRGLPPSDKSKDVVPYDPLQAYLREMRRYPPLSREEEFELAVRYLEHKDIKAAYLLVTHNLWLVVKIARDYEKAARSLLDLIQEGNMGLLEAVKNFDPYRGVRFPSYAIWWVRAYIIRYVIANWRLVKIGTTQAQRKLFFNLKRERDRLEREGFSPHPKLLAERLNVKESEVVEMEQRLGLPDLSVDAPSPNEGEGTLASVLPAEGENSEELLARAQVFQLIEENLEAFSTTLNKKESAILQKRLLSEEKATLQELSDELSISRERVRQLENRLKDKFKAFLEDKYGATVAEQFGF